MCACVCVWGGVRVRVCVCISIYRNLLPVLPACRLALALAPIIARFLLLDIHICSAPCPRLLSV